MTILVPATKAQAEQALNHSRQRMDSAASFYCIRPTPDARKRMIEAIDDYQGTWIAYAAEFYR